MDPERIRCFNCHGKAVDLKEDGKTILVAYEDDRNSLVKCLFFCSMDCAEGYKRKANSIRRMDDLYFTLGKRKS